MESKSFDSDLSDMPVVESSSMNFSELTSVDQDFGEEFVNILRATGSVSEELLPSTDEINDIIQQIPASDEFTDWFCKSITISNVVSGEELKVCERYKDIPTEEIEEYLGNVLGKQDDTVKLTEQTVNKLSAEEALWRQNVETTKKAKQFIQNELKETEKRKASLLKVIKETKSNINRMIIDISKMRNECLKESDKFFEEMIKCGLAAPQTEAKDQGEVKSLSQLDPTNFNTKNTAVFNDLMTSLSPLMQQLVINEKETLNVLAEIMKKYKELGVVENESANSVMNQYLRSLISHLESCVELTTSLNSVADQLLSINSILSSLFRVNEKEIIVTSSIVDNLMSQIEMNSQSDLITKNSMQIPTTSFYAADTTINHQISKLNEALSGSKDFISIESFAKSLEELDGSLIELEAIAAKHICNFNKRLIKIINTIKMLLNKITENIEDPSGDLKMLREYNEKFMITKEFMEKSNLSQDKTVVSSAKALYENMILLSITDPRLFKIKLQEMKRKIKLLEGAVSIF